MTNVDELLQIDNDLIDPETGEVIEQSDPVTEVLPRLCGRMRSLDKLVIFQEDYRNGRIAQLQREINRITESVGDKIVKLYREKDNLMGYAVRLVEAASAETFPRSKLKVRVHYPGIGVFKWAVLKRESVDTSGYDAMDDDEKRRVQNQQKGAFKTTTKVNPDQREILKNLNSGVERPGFSITPKVEGWTFETE